MKRRTWFKIFCDGWLRGTIRKESAITRSVFVDLLAMAGDSAYGEDGVIKLADNVGFDDDSISAYLNIEKEQWIEAKNMLFFSPKNSDERRIEVIPLKVGFEIVILNWKKYQSDYSRTKSYRGKKDKKHSVIKPVAIPVFNPVAKDVSEGVANATKRSPSPSPSPSPSISYTKKEEKIEEGKEEKKLKINFNFDLACWENITDKDMSLWQEAYPAVNIGLALSQMKNWVVDHPEKKKKNWRAFISRWLSRDQERGGTRKPRTAGEMTDEELIADYERTKKLKEAKNAKL